MNEREYFAQFSGEPFYLDGLTRTEAFEILHRAMAAFDFVTVAQFQQWDYAKEIYWHTARVFPPPFTPFRYGVIIQG